VNARGKRKHKHSFVAFPHHMLRSPALVQLSGWACKTLLFLAEQYNGSNNGDLQATFEKAKAAGWTSKANFWRGLRELGDQGLAVKSRQGGRDRCSLYALT
jgi:hypothetical protein